MIPIHFGALLVVLGVMTFMGVTNHMGWELFPAGSSRGGGRWLITASHHHRHHEQYGCNYGLYFSTGTGCAGRTGGLVRSSEPGRGRRLRGVTVGGVGGAIWS